MGFRSKGPEQEEEKGSLKNGEANKIGGTGLEK